MHETTTQDPETLFRAATDFLRSRSPQTFDPWFAGVQFESLTDGVLALRARDEFIRAWVDEHFLPTLTDFLRGETGWSIQVAWSVGGELDRPIVSRPYEPPVRTAAADAASVRAVRSVRPVPAPRSPSTRRRRSPGRRRAPRADEHRAAVDSGRGSAGRGAGSGERRASLEGLNAKYTFANFVIGPSNQLAHAAAIGAAGRRRAPAQPALPLRRHGSRQDAPGPRRGPPRPRGAARGAHPLRVGREVRQRVRPVAAGPEDERVPRPLPRALRPAPGGRHPVPRQQDADAGRILPRVQRPAPGGQADHRHQRQVPAAAGADGGAPHQPLHLGARGRHPGSGARDPRRHPP